MQKRGVQQSLLNVHGVKVHAGRCRWRQFYFVEKILWVPAETLVTESFESNGKATGPNMTRGNPETTSPHSVSPTSDFLKTNDLYDYDRDPETRYPYCDKPCKSKFGVKIHLRWCLYRAEKEQKFKDTVTDKQVRFNKVSAAQKTKTKVKCEDSKLSNVFNFKYLGSVFQPTEHTSMT